MPPNPTPPPSGGGGLVSRKWLGVPVVAWAGIGLVLAYLYRQYSAAKTAAAAASSSTTATTTAAGEPATTPPQYVIENNMPYSGGWSKPTPPTGTTTPSSPVTPPTNPITTPPTISPPISVRGPVPVGGTGTGGATSASPKAISYTVHSGDNLSSIAAKYGTTWQALWAYNTTPGNRSAQDIQTLLSRGPNLIYAGETILIPTS